MTEEISAAGTALFQPAPRASEKATGAIDPGPATHAAAPLSVGRAVLSAEQISSARENWIEQGLSAEAFDAAVGPKPIARAEVEYLPSAYRVDYGPLARGLDPTDLGKFSGEASGWLSALGLEPNTGASLLQHLMANSRAYSAMTPSQRVLYEKSELREATRQAGGGEQLKAALARVGQALLRCGPKEKLTGALLHRGAFDAFAILTLSTAEEIREARAAARKAKP
jgi:hypothetical protein